MTARYNGRSTGIFRFGKATTGNTQLGMEFIIEEAGDRRGQRETWYGTLGSPEATELAANAIAACTGQPLRSWAAFAQRAEKRPDGSLYHKALTRCDVSLVFETETYEGKERTRLSFVNPAGGVAMKDVLEGADLTKVLFGVDKVAGLKPPADDDDLPF